ncbi:MAG: VOC family protein [Alicyclobacillus sp.]|nr:VOC family protein [Alicyclobacillus sp.]
MPAKKVEHTGIMVRNIEESVDFYTKVLGMELKGILEHNVPGLRLGFMGFPGSDDKVIELIEGYNPNLPAEGLVHHVAFTVNDIEAETARLRALNVKFLDEGITTLRNGARYIFFEGPNGEHLELFQPGE